MNPIQEHQNVARFFENWYENSNLELVGGG